jgi:cysteine-rich repeat protein
VGTDGTGGVCFAATTACLDGNDPARFVLDGSPCGTAGSICIARSCVPASCGDGVVTLAVGEECDDGVDNGDVADACRATCVLPACGDGIVDGGEECDAGADNGDAANACRATCVLPACGDGIVDDGEACDTGSQNSDVRGGACRTTCLAAACGDSVRDPGEECDEGPLNSDAPGGSCRSTCVRAACGDGVLDVDEDCDDGNVASGDGCRADCGKVERCGDGELDVGDSDDVREAFEEECDDGNDNPVDGCADCRHQTWRRDLLVNGRVQGQRALDIGFAEPTAAAVDALGRIYVADGASHVVRRIDVDGTVTTVAGNGSAGFSGDGGQATSARLELPVAVAVDASGRLYVADRANHRVRRIDANGIITTHAGTGTAGFSGDGGQARDARLNDPRAVTVDPAGRLVIADRGNARIRRVANDGTITTIAGVGTAGNSGDGGPATQAEFESLSGVFADAVGRIFIVDANNHDVRRIDLDGTIVPVAGANFVGFCGDGGLAISACLYFPIGVAVDPAGRVFIADRNNGRIRRVETNGVITTVAGTGLGGFSGDGGPSAAAQISGGVTGVTIDNRGRLLIVDGGNKRLRRIDEQGVINTVAGTGATGAAGDGGPATSAPLRRPSSVAAGPDGAFFVADFDGHRVRRIAVDGTITTVAGIGAAGFAGDGGPATSALLSHPAGIAVDPSGRVYIADQDNHRVRRIELDGTIRTVAGTGTFSSVGDGVLATETGLAFPSGVAVDAGGRLFIASLNAHTVLRVDVDGTSHRVAGTGTFGSSQDGGLATESALNFPINLAVDASGGLLIVDRGSHRVRRIETDGTISTVAGQFGTIGFFAGDGGLANRSFLHTPTDVTVDAQGQMYIVDQGNQRVRKVGVDGIIRTLAGTGIAGLAGDFGSATNAQLDTPASVAVDGTGRVLIADQANDRLRLIDVDGTITTMAGLTHPAGPGSFERAQLYASRMLVPLGADLLSVGDFGRIVRLALDARVAEVVVGYDAAAPSSLASRVTLHDARGIAFDPDARTLVITEAGTAALTVVHVDIDDDGNVEPAAAWTHTTLPTTLLAPAGIAFDDATATFVVADEAAHCVVRLDRAGTLLATLAGRCGAPGSFPGFLDSPSHVALSPHSGAFYVADTNNHRVLRVLDDATVTVIGDGSVSSAGEGTPARLSADHIFQRIFEELRASFCDGRQPNLGK